MGEQLSVDGTVGATRLRGVLARLPFKLAVMRAVLLVVTPEAEAAKLALEAPAATVTEAGVVTKALLSERATVAPPVGAAAFRATVQVAEPAPVMRGWGACQRR